MKRKYCKSRILKFNKIGQKFAAYAYKEKSFYHFM